MLTEHHERRDRETEPRRELTEEEQRFFGTERSRESAPETDEDVEHREHYHADAAPVVDDEPVRAGIDERDAIREERHESDLDRPPERPRNTVEAGAERLDTATALFPAEEADSLRTRWDSVQTEFVDEPRAAVEKADALVGDVMQRLSDGFSHERSRLEREWDRGEAVSTEDLRVALKRYRSFFDRLLSV